MLEALARANDVPDESLLELYRLAVSEGAEKFPVVGAQGPFWGIESVDVRVLQDQDAALVREVEEGRTRPE
ncbi:hypothetical protein ACUXJ6_000019 [Kocuria palustris]|jgi:hypothetical protein|nr:hypothetical protein Kosp01_08860 [Kocuria sp. NBRC 114282]